MAARPLDMVSGASWTPSYDIRVDTSSSIAELALSYFGLVINSSGEDWDGCSLALSTAKPSKAELDMHPFSLLLPSLPHSLSFNQAIQPSMNPPSMRRFSYLASLPNSARMLVLTMTYFE